MSRWLGLVVLGLVLLVAGLGLLAAKGADFWATIALLALGGSILGGGVGAYLRDQNDR